MKPKLKAFEDEVVTLLKTLDWFELFSPSYRALILERDLNHKNFGEVSDYQVVFDDRNNPPDAIDAGRYHIDFIINPDGIKGENYPLEVVVHSRGIDVNWYKSDTKFVPT